MDELKLIKANKLFNKIKAFNRALSCFEHRFDDESDISTNPTIIIEYDGGDDRETEAIPMSLNDEFISILKAEIIKGRAAVIAEFEAL